jgi:hypothetical protein
VSVLLSVQNHFRIGIIFVHELFFQCVFHMRYFNMGNNTTEE